MSRQHIRRAPSLAALWVVSSLALIATTGAGGQSMPTPSSSLGFEPGADFQLATYEQSGEYFRRLDEASDHLTLLHVGRTSEGREWFMALVSTPENLANVERYRRVAQRLAHPEGLTDEAARELAREGKAFVDINGGLHATDILAERADVADRIASWLAAVLYPVP